MKRLICELCESTDIVKDGGVFVCQVCGCKYSLEEAKKMMEDPTEEQVSEQAGGNQGKFGEKNRSESQEKYGERQIQMTQETWVCPECETINSADKCILCGQIRVSVPKEPLRQEGSPKKEPNSKDIAENSQNGHDQGKKPSKKLITVVGLAAVILGVVLLLANLHTHTWKNATCITPKTCTICGKRSGSTVSHSWKAATCTTPKTCKTCGEKSGSALGHSWKAATCTTPKTCKTCGETSGSTLSHTWEAATYEAPKTCSVCNKTEGKEKGYIGTVGGSRNETFYRSGRRTGAYVLNKKIENCRKFTINFGITKVHKGNPYGNFEIFVRTGTKEWEWKSLGVVKIKEKSVEIPFELDPGISFDAVAVMCNASGSYSYSESISISDVYVY